MFSQNDEWEANGDADILNKSLFDKDATAVKLLSYTKLLNSTSKTTKTPADNTTTATTSTTITSNKSKKRKLPDTPSDIVGGKKKKKKKVLADNNEGEKGDKGEKKVALTLKMKKKNMNMKQTFNQFDMETLHYIV